MAEIFSVSISDKELLDWMGKYELEENKRLSLSAILRDALKEIKRVWEINKDLNVTELQRKIEVWTEIVDNQREFLSEKKLLDEYIEFEEKKKIIKIK